MTPKNIYKKIMYLFYSITKALIYATVISYTAGREYRRE